MSGVRWVTQETYVDDAELYKGSGEKDPGILPAVAGDEEEPWPVGGGGEEGEEEDGEGGEEVEGGQCTCGGGHRVQEGQQRYRRHFGSSTGGGGSVEVFVKGAVYLRVL